MKVVGNLAGALCILTGVRAPSAPFTGCCFQRSPPWHRGSQYKETVAIANIASEPEMDRKQFSYLKENL